MVAVSPVPRAPTAVIKVESITAVTAPHLEADVIPQSTVPPGWFKSSGSCPARDRGYDADDRAMLTLSATVANLSRENL